MMWFAAGVFICIFLTVVLIGLALEKPKEEPVLDGPSFGDYWPPVKPTLCDIGCGPNVHVKGCPNEPNLDVRPTI